MQPSALPIDQLTVLRTQTLTSLVQQDILRQIKHGELTAGAKLNELELSQRLNISRSPAREALAALQEAGLVRLEKNRGAYIREISMREAAELYEVRQGLDEMAGRIVARRITDQQIEDLRSSLDDLERSSDRGDMFEYYNRNIVFHDKIIGMTGNATLFGVYQGIINRMHLLRRRGLGAPGHDKASSTEHRLIVEALCNRDPLAASFHMGNHVSEGYKRFLATQ